MTAFESLALPDRQCPQRTPHGWHVEGSDTSDPPMGKCAGVTSYDYTRSLETERDSLRAVVEQVRAERADAWELGFKTGRSRSNLGADVPNPFERGES